jgi:hypothetical protein
VDYEIVILVSGSAWFGFANFISWSAQTAPPTRTDPPTTEAKETIMKTSPSSPPSPFRLPPPALHFAQEATYDYPQPPPRP